MKLIEPAKRRLLYLMFSIVSFVLYGNILIAQDYDKLGLSSSLYSDLAVWRPSTGTWYILPSSGICPANFISQGFHNGHRYCAQQWGLSEDIPIGPSMGYLLSNTTTPFDNLLVYRPSNATWYDLNGNQSSCSNGFMYAFNHNGLRACTKQWGFPNDVPLPSAYSSSPGTGSHFRPAVYRPSNQTWYAYTDTCPRHMSYAGVSDGYPFCTRKFGTKGDTQLVGDLDNDFTTELITFNKGIWYILPSTLSCPRGTVKSGVVSKNIPKCKVQFGLVGDKPIVKDFDGDQRGDITVWRPSTGEWYAIASSGVCPMHMQKIGDINGLPFCYQQWGLNGDIPVPSNYSVNQTTGLEYGNDLAVWRPSTGQWYIMPKNGNCPSTTQFLEYYRGRVTCTQQWGLPGDIPAPGYNFYAYPNK